MEWMQTMKKTIRYLENHILEDDYDVSKELGISSYYLQKGFRIITGYSMNEYVRNRRLYLAALEIIEDKDKVIDIAYKYGYETPESFSKAFSRFHGVSPMQLKKDSSQLHVFLPLKISIEIQGGNEMDFIVEKMDGFKVIGFESEVSYDTSYQDIPKLWQDFHQKYLNCLMTKHSENEIEETILKCHIGMFGICVDASEGKGHFKYLIAGMYNGEDIPEGMVTYEFPDLTWAKFLSIGQLPTALQAVNTKIFKEWLPGNPDYDIAMSANIEYYSLGNPESSHYESAIWIPVKSK